MSQGCRPPPNDPWAHLDGRLNAPAGAAQYPNALQPYPTATSPNLRYLWPNVNSAQPPWRVAGVDYAVGVDSGVTLQDPWPGYPSTTVSTAFASGFISQCGGASNISVQATNQVAITASNITISGWDFTTHGGFGLYINSGSNVTVQNCNFKINPGSAFFSGGTANYNLITLGTGASNVTISKCVLDGNGVCNAAIGQGLIEGNSGGLGNIIQYCWVKSAFNECIVLGNNPNSNSATTIQYCIMEGAGVGQANGATPAGAHGDWTQFVSSSMYANQNSVTVTFCFMQQISLETNMACQGLSYNGNVGGPFGSDIMTNNTCIANNSSSQLNNFFNPDYSWVRGTGFIDSNYCDPTGLNVNINNWCQIVGGTGGGSNNFSGNNNINMLTGAKMPTDVSGKVNT